MTARRTHPIQPRIPIGLQVVARLVDGLDADWSYVRSQLAKADRHAVTILTDPLSRLEQDGAHAVLDTLATEFGADEPAQKITDALPDAVPDPGAWLTEATVPWANAGLFLGLCLGWRLAGALAGKDGAR